jgi:hypothetical protein
MISATHVGCSTARNKGTCSNRVTIKRAALEERVAADGSGCSRSDGELHNDDGRNAGERI